MALDTLRLMDKDKKLLATIVEDEHGKLPEPRIGEKMTLSIPDQLGNSQAWEKYLVVDVDYTASLPVGGGTTFYSSQAQVTVELVESHGDMVEAEEKLYRDSG